MTCTSELQTILWLVKAVLDVIRIAIPILLIVLVTFDVAKIVTAGNLDDKLKKEVSGKVITRLVYAVIIFLIPTIVWMIIGWLPASVTNQSGSTTGNMSIKDCYNNAVKPQ